MVKNKDMQFFMENLKMNKKKDKNFLTLQRGDSNPRFSVIFQPAIWIFMEGEGDEINSRWGSKNYLTLLSWVLGSWSRMDITVATVAGGWIWPYQIQTSDLLEVSVFFSSQTFFAHPSFEPP